MLVLSRKPGETIVIDGVIRIEVLEVKAGQVRLGITAPRSHQIYRHEVYVQIQEENRAATASPDQALGLAALVSRHQPPAERAAGDAGS